MSFSVTDKVHIGKVSDDFSTHNWKEIDLSSLLPKVWDYTINMGIKSQNLDTLYFFVCNFDSGNKKTWMIKGQFSLQSL